MVYVSNLILDTVGLVHYLEDDMPRSAAAAIERVEQEGGNAFLPQIALGEFIYIALKGRVRMTNSTASVGEVVDQIKHSQFILISSMPINAWDTFLQLKIPELHDRLIAAEALDRKLPLISNDPSFAAIPGLKLIWK